MGAFAVGVLGVWSYIFLRRPRRRVNVFPFVSQTPFYRSNRVSESFYALAIGCGTFFLDGVKMISCPHFFDWLDICVAGVHVIEYG